MRRAAYCYLPFVFSFACNQPSAKPEPPPSTTTAAASASAPAATVAPTASASAPAPVASAAASGSARAGGACAALEWDKDGLNAKATTFNGKIGNGEGQNGRAETERFQTLVLAKPACGPDGAPVDEVQLYTNDKTIDLKKMVGKTVTLEGEPFSSHTAHHHRPIVFEVKKLSAK